MTKQDIIARVDKLAAALHELTRPQLAFIESVVEHILNQCGKRAALAAKGNPGHDITIEGVPCSLKTQADANIKENKLHISKFMELGKGHWLARVKDLEGLRDQFCAHMTAYERIFSLRCLSKERARWHYELVEIPKALLEEAKGGKLSIRRQSRMALT